MRALPSRFASPPVRRRWKHPHRQFHPTVYHARAALRALAASRPVALFCDLHGHSREFNIFAYGCERIAGRDSDPASRLKQRVFPHLLWRASPAGVGPGASPPALLDPDIAVEAKGGPPRPQQPPRLPTLPAGARDDAAAAAAARCESGLGTAPATADVQLPGPHSGRFAFSSCRFVVRPSKAGTARVVGWADVGVANTITLEASFMGAGDSSVIGRRWAASKRMRRYTAAASKAWFAGQALPTDDSAAAQAGPAGGAVAAAEAAAQQTPQAESLEARWRRLAAQSMAANSIVATAHPALAGEAASGPCAGAEHGAHGSADGDRASGGGTEAASSSAAGASAVLLSVPEHVRFAAEHPTLPSVSVGGDDALAGTSMPAQAAPGVVLAGPAWSPLMPPRGLAAPALDGTPDRPRLFTAVDLQRQGRDICIALVRFLGLEGEVRELVEARRAKAAGGASERVPTDTASAEMDCPSVASEDDRIEEGGSDADAEATEGASAGEFDADGEADEDE